MEDLRELELAMRRCYEARLAAQEPLARFVEARLRWVLSRSRVLPPHLRDDIYQHTMLQIIDSFDFFAGSERWHSRIMNHLRDTVRAVTRRHFARQKAEESLGLGDVPSFDQAAAERAIGALNLDHLAALEAHQAVSLLLLAGGVKQSEIARARGISEAKMSRDLAAARDAYHKLAGRDDG